MVVTLTINRPASRNPLGEAGDGEGFAEAAAHVNADRDVRCLILTGAGPAFSAGGNLKAMRERGGSFAGSGTHIREHYRGGIHKMVRALWDIEVPMIAAVNGPAIGSATRSPAWQTCASPPRRRSSAPRSCVSGLCAATAGPGSCRA